MDKIWPRNMKIQILGVSGPFGCGKTLFLLTIDPHNTLYFDFENSGGTYEELGVERVDVPGEMQKKYSGNYTPLQTFLHWHKRVKAIEPGKYSVIAADPITDIEDGMVDWVKSRYKEFGFNSPDKFVAMGGVFWSKVKSEWKIVLTDIAARCQTFAFATHLKTIWKHGRPTAEQMPRGKATLMEVTSLYLLLDRTPEKSGDVPPLLPSGMVLKSRLNSIANQDGKVVIVPSLPPRLPEATPQAIRDYIVKPPDRDNLSDAEREFSKELTEAEKLEIQAKIAEDTRAAAETELVVLDRQKMLDEAKAKAQADAIARMQPSQAKEEPHSNGKSNGLLPEDQVRDMLRTAHSKGVSERVLKGVWNTLSSRGVDVKGFNLDTAVDFTRMLKQDEFDKFSKHLTGM